MPQLAFNTPAAAWSLLAVDSLQVGHRLRLRLADTALIARGGVLTAWLATAPKTGVVHAVSASELSVDALQQRLTRAHSVFAEPSNPHGAVAMAHFTNGLSWLVNAAELQQLLSGVRVGTTMPPDAGRQQQQEQEQQDAPPELCMLQAFIVPEGDQRFVTTFGGADAPATTTQVRSYGVRYMPAASPAAAADAARAMLQQAAAACAGSNGANRQQQQPEAVSAQDNGPGESSPCSSSASRAAFAGLQVAVQDVPGPPPAAAARHEAFGSCCATPTLSGAGSGQAWQASQDAAVAKAAPARVAAAAAAAVQALMSHIDKARGLRVQGLVAEFILPQGSEQLVLIGLPQVTLDPQRSLVSSGATFTDAWGAFLAGAGPPPAPEPATHTSYLSQAGSLVGSSGRPVDAAAAAPRGAAPARPLSAPRASVVRRSPSPGGSAAAAGGVQHASRPATASPARMRPSTASQGTRAAASCRPGAGGNPVLHAHSSAHGSDACRLWLLQPRRPADSITAQLAAQLDAAEARVQALAAHADAATLMAQAALAQAAQQVAAVAEELQELRADAGAAGHERRQLLASLGGLHEQRAAAAAAMQAMQQQLANLQAELAQDRATLATSVHQHQQREHQLQEDLAASTAEAAELRAAVAQLTCRLDEEGEVVAALRAQLLDYKLQLGSLQLAAKKGRQLNTSASTTVHRRGGGGTSGGGAATPPLLLHGGGSLTGATTPGPWSIQAGSRRQTQTQQAQPQASSRTTTPAAAVPRGDAGQQGAPLPAPPAPASSGPAPCGPGSLAPPQAAGNSLSEPSRQAAGKVPGAAVAAPTSGLERLQQHAVGPEGGGGAGSGGRQPLPSTQPQCPAPAVAPGSSALEPEALEAAMVAGIRADAGGCLGPPAREAPALEIGDLLLGDPHSPAALRPDAASEAAARAQVTLIGGLMRDVATDLDEVFTHYALLGRAGQVAGDRLVLELTQLRKLAYDVHVAQDPRSLSAIEDSFYAITDRRPDDTIGAATITSSSSSSSRPGSPAAAASSDVLLPSEFAEALVRLACVRYRWGPVAFEYGWDRPSDSDDSLAELDGAAAASALSPRSQRMRLQLQQQQQERGGSGGGGRGPRVLRPEGGHLLLSSGASGGVASSSSLAGSKPRSASPARPGADDDASTPTASDSLVTVVRTFVQQEVLRHARRSKLAGSSLGHRRAREKPATLQGWETLPPVSGL